MKRIIPFTAVLLAAGSLLAADASPKDAVTAAAAKLGASESYSWKTTTETPGGGGGGGGGRFRPGPTEGKTEKDGYTWVSFTQGDNTSQAVLKGTNGVLKTDGDWTTLADAAKDDGGGGFNPARFLAMRLQNFKSPGAETEALIGKLGEIKLADGVYSGDLTEDAAKERLFPFGRPPGGGDGPAITGAKGSAKFWITDGVLTKVELNVQGHVEFNGNGRDVNRTTTTEIKDIGKTKVEVPDDAKKKLS